MIEVSQSWINYFKEHDVCKMRATLTDVDGNTMSLDETDFMMGSVRLSDSVSTSSAFDVGSVITNTIDCTLNNIDKKFDDFNLNDARLSVEFGLEYEGNLFDGMSFEYTYITAQSLSQYGFKSQKIHINHGEQYTINATFDPFETNITIGQIYWYKGHSEASALESGTIYAGETSYHSTFTNDEFDYVEIYLLCDALPTNTTFSITGTSDEWISKGTYTFDNPTVIGNTIQCIGYNDMDKLNKPYIGLGVIDGVVTPLDEYMDSSDWVEAIALYCGVPFGSWEINSDLYFSSVSYNESTTCRDVISWIIQINGGFARIDENDALSVRWYSPGTFQESGTQIDGGGMNPWDTVDSLDGGGMNPWNDVGDIADGGSGYLYELDQLSQATISSEDIHVTGVRVAVANTYENPESALIGKEGYVIQITDNPLVSNKTLLDNPDGLHYLIVANIIYSVIGGYRFKTFDASLYGNPAMEAGDLIGIKDYRNRLWTSYITSLNYTFNGLTEARCEAETITEANSSYGDYGVSIASNAVDAVYTQLNNNKLSADLIGKGTISDPVTATDFNIDTQGLSLEASDTVGNLKIGEVFYANSDGEFNVNGDGDIKITGDVTANSFINTSQVELKENIRSVDSMLQKVVDADILKFNFKEDDAEHIGLVIGDGYHTPEEVIGESEGRQGIDLYSMIAMAWKAIQEQQKEIEKLKGEIDGNTDKKGN